MAAVSAGLFTNPIDIVKIRLQLQGELERKGSYKKIYKNTFHAVYLIGKHEGIFALQSAIVPALGFQVVLNGIRLGSYKFAKRYNFIENNDGHTNIFMTAMVAGVSGCVGAVLGSPLYLVRIQFIDHMKSFITFRIKFI